MQYTSLLKKKDSVNILKSVLFVHGNARSSVVKQRFLKRTEKKQVIRKCKIENEYLCFSHCFSSNMFLFFN